LLSKSRLGKENLIRCIIDVSSLVNVTPNQPFASLATNLACSSTTIFLHEQAILIANLEL